MMYSMTGFGKATVIYASKKISIELRALNGRYAEINLKIPPEYKEKEIIIRKQLATQLRRGKIECSIAVDYEEEATTNLINQNLLKTYYHQLKKTANELNIEQVDLLPSILRLQQIFTPEKTALENEEWLQLEAALQQAITELIAFRGKEGAHLKKDINERCQLISQNVAHVKTLLPARTEKIRQNLRSHLQQLKTNVEIDENRFEEELIYYLEKLDITEELVRLHSHLEGFEQLLNTNDIIKGKKLNFFSQEIGREINTIGAKANNATMQKTVVQMKDDLEKIKEQLLNIL